MSSPPEEGPKGLVLRKGSGVVRTLVPEVDTVSDVKMWRPSITRDAEVLLELYYAAKHTNP